METRFSEGEALSLLRQGRSDEDVERLTALTLVQIIGLRAGLAVARPPGILLGRRGPAG